MTSPSGTHQRVETIEDTLGRLLAKIDVLTDRVGDLRVELAEMRALATNTKGLIDGAHARSEKLEARLLVVEAAVGRIDRFEQALAIPSNNRQIVAVGAGSAAAGGVLVVLADFLHRLIGGLG